MNDKYITWQHLIYRYTCHNKVMDRAGLFLTNKITYEHVYLNFYSRMRVDLAAQVRYTQITLSVII